MQARVQKGMLLYKANQSIKKQSTNTVEKLCSKLLCGPDDSNQTNINIMSLLIVGSCSRVTQNLILKVGQTQSHKSVTILDLLPTYNYHQRFYQLQKQLITLNKLVKAEDLAHNIQKHDDIVCVTHDYFQSVTSKTKIIELTAQLSQNKKPVFAAPLEYDHFGLADPEGQFNKVQDIIFQKNSNAALIRSDIQNETEFLAFLHHPKNLLEERSFQVPYTFYPKIVESSKFSDAILQSLRGAHRGDTYTITGNAQDALTAPYNRQIELHQTQHHFGNVVHLIQKYRSLVGKVANIP